MTNQLKPDRFKATSSKSERIQIIFHIVSLYKGLLRKLTVRIHRETYFKYFGQVLAGNSEAKSNILNAYGSPLSIKMGPPCRPPGMALS